MKMKYTGEERSGEGHYFNKRESSEYLGGSRRDNGEKGGMVQMKERIGCWERVGGRRIWGT